VFKQRLTSLHKAVTFSQALPHTEQLFCAATVVQEDCKLHAIVR